MKDKNSKTIDRHEVELEVVIDEREAENGKVFEKNIDTAIDIISAIASVVPYIGGPLSNILSGISNKRKCERLKQFIQELRDELKKQGSRISESYVKTEEYEEILEETLSRVTRERSNKKQKMYKDFLMNAMIHPEETTYDVKRRIIRVLEDIQLDDIKVLNAILAKPQKSSRGNTGLQLPSLSSQLHMRTDHAQAIAFHLYGLGLTFIISDSQMLSLTLFGKQFMKFITE